MKMKTSYEPLIRAQDWIYEDAGTRWQDGLILGNGNLGVIGYAPYGLEWVLNKGDVFDGRINRGTLTPHRQVMERFFKERLTTVDFLGRADAPAKPMAAPISKSAALLRLHFGDESSWGAPRPHRVRQRLSLWEGELYTQAAYLLYPFFPSEAAGADGEAIAARTLDRMPRHDIEMSYADTRGRWHYRRCWAWFFPAVTRLRLGQRDAGWAALYECLRLFSKPNGLFSHNPIIEADPQATEANLRHIPAGRLRQADGRYSPLTEFHCTDGAGTMNPHARRWVTPASEGSGAFLFAATETLLQSHGGLIRLFPGVPRDFTGGFHRLLAQGAVEVSARMRRGVVAYCRLVARRRTVVRILSPWHAIPRLPRDARVEKTSRGRVAITIPLRRGQAVVLRPKND